MTAVALNLIACLFVGVDPFGLLFLLAHQPWEDETAGREQVQREHLSKALSRARNIS